MMYYARRFQLNNLRAMEALRGLTYALEDKLDKILATDEAIPWEAREMAEKLDSAAALTLAHAATNEETDIKPLGQIYSKLNYSAENITWLLDQEEADMKAATNQAQDWWL